MWNSLTQRLARRMIVVSALLATGCAESPPEATTENAPTVPTALRVETAPAKKMSDKKSADVVDAKSEAARTKDSTLADSPPKTYKPPYPDRNQLFQSPRVRRSSLAGRGTRDGAQRVQLRGFVNLDGIRAILIVNGETNSMAAGDVSDGIEVISINPPRVTLQRSRVRWTETLQ